MSSTWRASASPALSTAASMVRAAVTRPESPGTTRYRRKGQPHEGDVVLAHLRRGYRFSSRFRFLYGTVKPRRRASRVGGKKLVDCLSTKAKVEAGKSVTSSAQPNCAS